MLVLGRLELHPDVWAELAEDNEALLLAVVPYVPLRCLGALRVHLHILRAIIQAAQIQSLRFTLKLLLKAQF